MATAVKKKEYNWDSDKTYDFELVGEGAHHQGKFIIQTTSTVFENNKYRRVRLAPTELSPYVDEQDESALPSRTPVVFKKGRLTVSGDQEYVLNYLMSLDHNVENNSKAKIKPLFKFKLVNKEENEKSKASLRKLKLKIQNILAEATQQELADYLMAEYNYTPKTDTQEEVFNKASAYAEVNPQHVLDTFQTEASKLKARLAYAFKKNVLKNTKGVITWSDTGTEILVLKPKENEQITDLMVDWISKNSKEAIDFVKKLATKMTV